MTPPSCPSVKDINGELSRYLGSDASFQDIFDLAEAYCQAANALLCTAKKGEPLTYAPARLCAIHATELYLNAFLRKGGQNAASIRGRLHNLADEEFVEALGLRKKTANHLAEMTKRREYLIS
jgi:hypothetical protein